MRYQRAKGTRDILPSEIPKWRHIERTSAQLLENYGYREIRTPTFEPSSLFARSIGETTDIVEKEMYSFKDRKGRDISLKPEGTAPIIRAYIEHGMSPPVKLYYSTSTFRYERPQKGRYREFSQIGVEAIGSLSPLLDTEVIELGDHLLRRTGLRNFTIKLNSIGCRECRAEYKKVLLDYIGPRKSSLCRLCRKRVNQNPFRILDCKDENCKKVGREAPAIADHLCSICSTHFESVKEGLDRLGVSYELEPRLFRGIDYYTKTTFEFVSGALGAKDAILGGGRYDHLVEELGGPDTPAIGWAFGVDRLILALEQEEFDFPEMVKDSLFVAWTTEATKQRAVEMTYEMRKGGIPCEMEYGERSLRSQLNLANRLGFRSALIVGDEELKGGEVVLRDMKTGAQERIPVAGLKELLKERFRPC